MNTEELIDKAVEMQDSFERVYQDNYALLINHARHKIGNVAIAEDIVHDLFAEVYLKFDSIDNIEGYLFISLKRRIMNHWRHQDVRRAFIEYKQTRQEVTTKDPQKEIELKERLRHVLERVEKMPDNYRKVFELKLYDFSNKEIAERMNVSIKTVEAYFTKVRKILKASLVSLLFILLNM